MKTSLLHSYHLVRAAIYFSALFTFTSPRDKGVSVFTLIWSKSWNELFFDSLMTQRDVVLLLVDWTGALVNNLKNHLTPRHTKLQLIATLSKKVQQFNHRHTRYTSTALLRKLLCQFSDFAFSPNHYSTHRGQEICGFNFNKAGFVLMEPFHESKLTK